MKNKTLLIILIVLASIFFLIISILGGIWAYYAFFKNDEGKAIKNKAEEVMDEIDSQEDNASDEEDFEGDKNFDYADYVPDLETNGTISGSLSFPSEGIPSTLRICAENASTSEESCTDEHLEGDDYMFGYGYELEVPAGSYYVYSYDTANPDYYAYYTEFVTCGSEYGCPSHAHILVEVEAGEIVSDVDPTDWYDY